MKTFIAPNGMKIFIDSDERKVQRIIRKRRKSSTQDCHSEEKQRITSSCTPRISFWELRNQSRATELRTMMLLTSRSRS